MRILIAEDDEALARFVRQGLEAKHYSVDVLPDGEQARTAATQFEYDVVILDLNLPKLDRGQRSPPLALEKTEPARAGANPAYAGGRPRTVPGYGRGRLRP
jgi:CheY-like chemotaxis protein